MKIYKYISVLALSMLTLTSCYQDLGNYDYKDISEVTIAGMENTYRVTSRIDNLTINPKVTSTGTNDQFDYLWLIYKSVKNEETNKIKADTLSTADKLNLPVVLSSGEYKLWLRLTNKATGRETYKMAMVTVVTRTNNGFYLLKETEDGNTDMDFFDGSNNIFENVITYSIGRAMEGKPTSLTTNPIYSYQNAETGLLEAKSFINVVSEKEVNMFRVEDLNRVRQYNDMFMAPQAGDDKPLFFIANYYAPAFFSSKGYYFNYQNPISGSMTSGLFSSSVIVDAKGYTLTPNFICEGGYGAVVHDRANRRFLGINYHGTMRLTSSPPYEVLAFGAHQTGASGATYDGKALYKNGVQRIIANLAVRVMTRGGGTEVSGLRSIPATLKIYEATKFAFCRRNSPVMYFLVENQFYTFNTAVVAPVTAAAEAPLTISGLPADEEVTYFDTIFNETESVTGDGDKTNHFDHFVVATYKAGRYTVRMYNLVGGIPVGEPVKIYSGVGKVTSVNYVDPKQGMNLGNRTKMSWNF